MKSKLLLPVFLLALTAYSHAQSVDDILSTYFDTVGGREKLKALQSTKATGNMFVQGFELPFTAHAKRPNKVHMHLQIQGVDIIEAYDGNEAWALNPFAGGKDPVKMTPEESKEYADRELESEFIDYKSKGHEVSLLGTEEVEGVKCFKIQLVKNKLNDKEDFTQVYYFDSENYVPIMISALARSGPLKGTETQTFLSDYQDVEGGLIMPFSVDVRVNGQTVQKLSYQTMSLNVDIDDSIFSFPKK